MKLFEMLFGPAIPSLDPEEARKRLQARPRPLLLDVRQVEEFQQGHISGARHLPLQTLAAEMDQLPRDAEIICVCRSGSRSHSAAKMLAKAGFRASNLSGGLLAWQRERLPLQKGRR